MKLSDNFHMHEFTRSRVAVQNDYPEQFVPSSEIINNILKLVQEVLQPVRVELQSWMYITSGYRCRRVNSHPDVKGSKNSDHMKGMAADITCKNTEQLYNLIQAMDLPYKQLIWYKSRNFVHVSFDPAQVTKQAWVIT